MTPLGAVAQVTDADGFWVSFDIGEAKAKFARSISGSHSTHEFTMNLQGGYHWGPKYFLGFEIGGFNLEENDCARKYEYTNCDPKEGVGIEQSVLTMRYYANPDLPWFLLGGIGQSKYWTKHLGETGGTGKVVELGLGRDFAVQAQGNKYYITPSLRLCSGNVDGFTSPPGIAQNMKYRTVSLVIGFTYR
jgi:hypothetical protein